MHLQNVKPTCTNVKPPIEDFLATVLYQYEVGFSSLVKMKPKYRNGMDVQLVFSVQNQTWNIIACRKMLSGA